MELFNGCAELTGPTALYSRTLDLSKINDKTIVGGSNQECDGKRSRDPGLSYVVLRSSCIEL